MPVVRAAGGLLWRSGPGGPRVALVHRPRRDDWSLPKGKLDEGEAWEAAALREVREETGCRARITAFAGASTSLQRRPPKVVLYWHMALVKEGPLEARDEVDEVQWLPPDQALARLDHDSDRRLLERGPVRVLGGRARETMAIAELRGELLQRDLELGASSDGVYLGRALELLDEADGLAAAGDLTELRALLLAARWLTVPALEEPQRSRRLAALRLEARRIAQRPRPTPRAPGPTPPEAVESTDPRTELPVPATPAGGQAVPPAETLEALEAPDPRPSPAEAVPDAASPAPPEVVEVAPEARGATPSEVEGSPPTRLAGFEGPGSQREVRRAVEVIAVASALALAIAAVLPDLRGPLVGGALCGLLGAVVVALAARRGSDPAAAPTGEQERSVAGGDAFGEEANQTPRPPGIG
jgi:8-oxo-dGTP diphosphatase